MKIYKRVVMDMTLPDIPVVEEESYEYEGPVALCYSEGGAGGGSANGIGGDKGYGGSRRGGVSRSDARNSFGSSSSGSVGGYRGSRRGGVSRSDARNSFGRQEAALEAANAALQGMVSRTSLTPVHNFYASYAPLGSPKNPLYNQYRQLRWAEEEAIRNQSQQAKDAAILANHVAARAATPISGLPMSAIEDLARLDSLYDTYNIGALAERGIEAPEVWGGLPGQGFMGMLFGDDEDKWGPDEAQREAKAKGYMNDDNSVAASLAYGPLATQGSYIAGPVVQGFLGDNLMGFLGGKLAQEAVASKGIPGAIDGDIGRAVLGALGMVSDFGTPLSALNTMLGLAAPAATLQAAGVKSPNIENGFRAPEYNGNEAQPMSGLMAGAPSDGTRAEALAAVTNNGERPWWMQYQQQSPWGWLV